MLSFSGFLRRLTRDAVLAGVEDAMRHLEPQASQDVPARMVEQLEERLKRHQQGRLFQGPTGQPADQRLGRPSGEQPPQAPQLPRPESNGQHPSTSKQNSLPPRKRGPGRPKKNPHPHAD
ncbi:MAG: hypothetical protein AB7P49_15230 [Bdellovibrionales bacterium]